MKILSLLSRLFPTAPAALPHEGRRIINPTAARDCYEYEVREARLAKTIFTKTSFSAPTPKGNMITVDMSKRRVVTATIGGQTLYQPVKLFGLRRQAALKKLAIRTVIAELRQENEALRKKLSRLHSPVR